MPLSKLNLTTPQEGYSVEDGEAVLRAKLSGGPGRQRLDMLGAASIVDVTLVLTSDEYRYWRAFFRSAIVEGSLPFLIDLVIDTADISEYQVQIIPGTTKLGSVQGDAHFVPMQLEVMMPVADAAYDIALVLLYELYGQDAGPVLDLLEYIVNEGWPV